STPPLRFTKSTTYRQNSAKFGLRQRLRRIELDQPRQDVTLRVASLLTALSQVRASALAQGQIATVATMRIVRGTSALDAIVCRIEIDLLPVGIEPGNFVVSRRAMPQGSIAANHHGLLKIERTIV